MICKQLTRAASPAWLLSHGTLGGGGGPGQNPLSGLARHGIKPPPLDEAYLGAQDGGTCHCSLAVLCLNIPCNILAATFGDESVVIGTMRGGGVEEALERNGGNALAIGGGRGALLLMNISVQWALASDDEAVLSACRNVIRRSEALARERVLHHPYLCYGAENKARLIEVAKKCNPADVFQTLRPGYFNLHGAPAV
ncbi:hypothetical protein DL770_005500 [Monosporascus sp. CRB-9-2]|nr:hypothetical protein DL770_005500 [Monosporascus sp. CRB-9-2]